MLNSWFISSSLVVTEKPVSPSARIAQLSEMTLEQLHVEFQALKIPAEDRIPGARCRARTLGPWGLEPTGSGDVLVGFAYEDLLTWWNLGSLAGNDIY